MEALAADAVARLESELGALAGAAVALERPADPAHGDYATNVALRLAGRDGRAPREIAAELAERAGTLAGIARAEVAGPGFLNLFLEDSWFVDALDTMLAAGDASAAARR
jgi:arginyl-tRNA synthetase